MYKVLEIALYLSEGFLKFIATRVVVVACIL